MLFEGRLERERETREGDRQKQRERHIIPVVEEKGREG